MWGQGESDMDGTSSKGGFMDSTFTGPNPTADGSGVTASDDKSYCLMPAWIGTILDTSVEELASIGNTNVSFVVIYGIVKAIKTTTTKLTVQLEDETGTIPVICFLESEHGEDQESSQQRQASTLPEDLEEGNTVLVYGKPRVSNDGEKYMLNICMRSLGNSYSQVFNHYLKIKLTEQRIAAAAGEDDDNNDAGNVTAREPDSLEARLTPEQLQILTLVKESNKTAHGITRDEIKKKVPPSVLPKVEDILDFFISEGHLYTTITEDHFKTT